MPALQSGCNSEAGQSGWTSVFESVPEKMASLLEISYSATVMATPDSSVTISPQRPSSSHLAYGII